MSADFDERDDFDPFNPKNFVDKDPPSESPAEPPASNGAEPPLPQEAEPPADDDDTAADPAPESPPSPEVMARLLDDKVTDAEEFARRQFRTAVESARSVVDLAEPDGTGDFRIKIFEQQTAELVRIARRLNCRMDNALLLWRTVLLNGYKNGEASLLVYEQSFDWLKAEIDQATEKAIKQAAIDDERERERLERGEPEPPPDAEDTRPNEPPPRLLRIVNSADWQDKPVPPRRWVVRDRIPLRAVTILAGDGGKGKTTIALQLCYAVRRNTDWLGAVIDEGGPALFFTAEEEHEEVQRRLDAIHKAFNTQFRDVPIDVISTLPENADDERLQDPQLGVVNKATGRVEPTQTFAQLRDRVREISAKLVVIESLADVFAVNEIDRQQARGAIAIARKLALTCDCAVVLLAHASRAGIKDASATSGSTQWRNTVRSFLTLGPATDAEDDASHQVTVHKANYGRTGETVRLVWRDGIYAPQGTPSSAQAAAAAAPVDEAFLRCLDAVNAQGLGVSLAWGRNYAPVVFETMTEARGYKKTALKAAMERLRYAERIRMENYRVDGKTRPRLVRVSAEQGYRDRSDGERTAKNPAADKLPAEAQAWVDSAACPPAYRAGFKTVKGRQKYLCPKGWTMRGLFSVPNGLAARIGEGEVAQAEENGSLQIMTAGGKLEGASPPGPDGRYPWEPA
jgi:RecA-family ATPase